MPNLTVETIPASLDADFGETISIKIEADMEANEDQSVVVMPILYQGARVSHNKADLNEGQITIAVGSESLRVILRLISTTSVGNLLISASAASPNGDSVPKDIKSNGKLLSRVKLNKIITNLEVELV